MRIRGMVLRNIASPYGMTAASLLIFFFAYLLPPAVYSSFIQEPDFLFLDPASLLFFVLCAMGFVSGLVLIDFIFPARRFSCQQTRILIQPMWFLLLPLIAGLVVTLYSIVDLLRNNAYLIEFLLTAQGDEVKSGNGLEVNGVISQAAPALMGIAWWALWRKDDVHLKGWRKAVVNFFIAVAVLATVVSSVLMLERGELMPIFTGLAVLVLWRRFKQGKLSFPATARFAAGFAALILAIFVSIGLLRGANDADFMISSVMGYTVASYNRLAAMLDGRLRYPFGGSGVYISAFAAFNHLFNSVFRLNSLFAWPDFNTVWRSEFDAVSAAGLDGRLIWAGTFGYIFSELGWLSPLMLFVYGLATGWAWRSLRLNQTVGIMLYPWCAFCILFWFGTNFLLDPLAVDLSAAAIMLSLYETLCSRSRTEVSQLG